MESFDIIPGVDSEFNFPPEIRQAMAEYPELRAYFLDKGSFDTHTGNESNPHKVTKAQVGLAKAENTTDAEKPVSVLQAAAISKKADGLIYEEIIQTTSPGITHAIIENIASFTFKAGRRYRIVWDSSYLQDQAAALFFWSIAQAPIGDAAESLADLTVLAGRTKGINSLNGSTQHTGPITAFYKPTVDITTQIKFCIQRVAGDGGVAVVSNEHERPTYQIYDDGAQTLPIP